jgi:signal peptidase
VSTVALAPSRRRPLPVRIAGRCVRLVLWCAFGFSVVFGTFLVAPGFMGLNSFAILSGSMEPTLMVGDTVIDRRIEARDARPGDIVTFRDPEDASRLLTHRIVKYRVQGDRAYIVTKGDANTGVEKWSIPLGGTVGRVEFDIPKLGYATMHAGGRFGRLGLIVVPALLLGLHELKRLWFPKEQPGDG